MVERGSKERYVVITELFGRPSTQYFDHTLLIAVMQSGGVHTYCTDCPGAQGDVRIVALLARSKSGSRWTSAPKGQM
jgi:hypothetical protein